MNQNNNSLNTQAPIALFVYNRPEHTKQTIEALKKNILANESELFIFSDGPKNENAVSKILEVRNYLKTISGFKKIEIIERPDNFGLAKSIITGVTDIVNRYGNVIVLEDDLVTSPHFLGYMNQALEIYEKEDRVISIHGYVYPVKENLPETFFLKGADCWGWATWKRGWDLFMPDGKELLRKLEERNLIGEFNFENTYSFSGMLKRQIVGKNNSWAVRWYASAFLNNKLTLYPGKSLVINIGRDGSGTHGSKNDLILDEKSSIINKTVINVHKIPTEENINARKIISNYFSSLKPSLLEKLTGTIIRLLK